MLTGQFMNFYPLSLMSRLNSRQATVWKIRAFLRGGRSLVGTRKRGRRSSRAKRSPRVAEIRHGTTRRQPEDLPPAVWKSSVKSRGYGGLSWSEWQDSNLRPPRPEHELPAENSGKPGFLTWLRSLSFRRCSVIPHESRTKKHENGRSRSQTQDTKKDPAQGRVKAIDHGKRLGRSFAICSSMAGSRCLWRRG